MTAAFHKYDLVMNLKIWQKILLIVSLPVLFEIVFVATLATMLLQTEKLSDQFETSKAALLRYHEAEEALLQGFFQFITIDASSEGEYAKEFDFLIDKLRFYENSISNTFGMRPEIRDAFEEVPELFNNAAKLIDKGKMIFRHPPSERRKLAKGMEPEMLGMMLVIKPLSDRIAIAERQMQERAPSELLSRRSYVVTTTIAGLILSLVISCGAAFLFFRNIAKRLQIIEDNAHRVALGQDLLPALDNQDEIGQLDAALHVAADLISDAKKKEFAILEQSIDVLCSLDRRLRIVDIGESVFRAWKHTADELIGRSILTLVP